MQVDPIILILIAIVIVLLIVISFLIGKKSNKPQNPDAIDIDVKTKPSHPPSTKYVRVNPQDFMNKQEITKDKNNPKYLSEISQLLNENLPKLAEMGAVFATMSFTTPYVELLEFLEENNEDLDIADIQTIISWVKIHEIRFKLEEGYINVADGLITDTYHNSLDELKKLYDDDIINKFRFSEDTKAIEKTKIINLLKQDTNPFYVELNHLQSLQNRLITMYPKAKEVSEDSGIDWGNLAKNFGGGALIAFNPIVGIPVLAANYFNESKKHKAKQQIYDDFYNLLGEYLSQWDKVQEANLVVYNKQVRILKDKIQSFLIENSINIFKKLDERGHSLKKAKDYVDQEMEELIKQIKEFEEGGKE